MKNSLRTQVAAAAFALLPLGAAFVAPPVAAQAAPRYSAQELLQSLQVVGPTGGQVIFRVQGIPGGSVRVFLPHPNQTLAAREVRPGVYEAVWVIRKGDGISTFINPSATLDYAGLRAQITGGQPAALVSVPDQNARERERREAEERARRDNDRARVDRERGERERADRERGERERADRERAERDRAERERAERERNARRDNRGPEISAVTPSQGDRVRDRGRTHISARFSDDASGVAAVTLRVDGRDVTRDSRIEGNEIQYREDLSPGRHQAEVTVRDRAGNVSRRTWTFDVLGNRGNGQGWGYGNDHRR